MKTRTHLSRLIPALLVKAFIAAWITFAFFHPFDDDEFQHTHFSWLINKGQLPYKDFFEHHMPVYHLFLSPLFFLTGGSAGIFLFRLVSVVSGLGTLLCVYLLSKRYASRTASALMVIIMGLTPMFMFKIVEARPASPAMLALSMAMLLLFGKEKGKWSDLTAGILAGLCVLLSQKYVFVTAGLILALIIQKRWRACLLTFMGMIIP